MDLISTSDILAGASVMMLIGVFNAVLMANFLKLWSIGMKIPLVQSIVNTTLVVLETTEGVWRPVLNSTALILKPIVSTALVLLKPIGPFALVLGDSIVRGLVVIGYVTTLVLRELYGYVRDAIRILQKNGVSVQLALTNAFTNLKDLTLSLGTVVRAAGYFATRLVHAASFVVESFERVGSFTYNIIFEAHKLTWSDVTDVALPFFVVTCILGYLMVRAGLLRFPRAAPVPTDTKTMFDINPPRRSSRLARKRAMLLSDDLGSALPCDKTTPRAPNL